MKWSGRTHVHRHERWNCQAPLRHWIIDHKSYQSSVENTRRDQTTHPASSIDDFDPHPHPHPLLDNGDSFSFFRHDSLDLLPIKSRVGITLNNGDFAVKVGLPFHSDRQKCLWIRSFEHSRASSELDLNSSVAGFPNESYRRWRIPIWSHIWVPFIGKDKIHLRRRRLHRCRA
jgi:hypothetical protein